MNKEELEDLNKDFGEFCELVEYTNFDSDERDTISKICDYMRDYISIKSSVIEKENYIDFEYHYDWSDYGRFTLEITVNTNEEDDNIVKTKLYEYLRSEFSYNIKEKDDIAYLTFGDGVSGTIFGKPLNVICEDVQNYKLEYNPNKFNATINTTKVIIRFDGRHSFSEEDFEDE